MGASLQGARAGPGPSDPAPDRFELLRRSKDLVVDIRQGYFCHYFCQFDAATGWPKHTLKNGTGPLPDSICKIDETAGERGISLRQLLVTYEYAKLPGPAPARARAPSPEPFRAQSVPHTARSGARGPLRLLVEPFVLPLAPCWPR
jgi:hypothetical protein